VTYSKHKDDICWDSAKTDAHLCSGNILIVQGLLNDTLGARLGSRHLYSAPITIGKSFIVPVQKSTRNSVKTRQCCGSGMFIPVPDISVIPDPGSYIKRGVQNKPNSTVPFSIYTLG
jgi:hypothetical protein